MRVIQVLDALDYGDGVGNDVIQLKGILSELGINNIILSRYCAVQYRGLSINIEKYSPKKDDIILFHFYGESSLIEWVLSQKGPRLLRYHNVTPPRFFQNINGEIAKSCKNGIMQIQKYADKFDGTMADSQFNGKDIIGYGARADSVDVLPIAFNFNKHRLITVDLDLSENLAGTCNFIVVGRLAANKCVEDAMYAFDTYYRCYNSDATLFLIGNDGQSKVYTNQLIEIRNSILSKNKIVFTGKVSEQELVTYYRNAAALLCMSEHEGFCMPLLEAANFDVPVIGFDAGAVPETMGKSGVLVYKKEPQLIAALMEKVVKDNALRRAVIEKQRENLKKYSDESIKKQLMQLLKKWEGKYRV